MSIIESIEYYSACPQCGAANIGKEKCEYCGTYLVKSKTNRTVDEKTSEEDKNYQEDIQYPEIKGKIYEKDDFLMLFCPLFGGMFIVLPIVISIIFISVGIMEPWLYAMFALFWLIGIGGLSPLVISIVQRAKCKNGDEITGIVRGYENSIVIVNGSPVLKMRVLINEYTNPTILVLGTGTTKRLFPVGKVIKLKGYNNKYIII